MELVWNWVKPKENYCDIGVSVEMREWKWGWSGDYGRTEGIEMG